MTTPKRRRVKAVPTYAAWHRECYGRGVGPGCKSNDCLNTYRSEFGVPVPVRKRRGRK